MTIKKAPYLYILLVICLTAILACSSEKKDLVNSFEEAINCHDVDLVMSFYDREVSIVMSGVTNTLFHDEMRPMAEWDAAMNTKVHFRVVDIKGDTVNCVKEEQSDWFRLFDIDTVLFDPWQFIIEKGKITAMSSKLSGKSALAMQYGMKAFTNWASIKHPKELEALMPEGVFTFGTDAANRWLELVREWRETVEKNK
jgi:hypothetical protein